MDRNDEREFWIGAIMGAITAAAGPVRRATIAAEALWKLENGQSGTPFSALDDPIPPISAGDDRRGTADVPLPNTSGTFPSPPRGCVCNPDEHAATFTRVWVCTHCGARRPGADPVPPTSAVTAGNLHDVAAAVCAPTVDGQLPVDAARLAEIARLPGPICGVQGCRCEPTRGHAYCHRHGELLDGFDWNGTAWVRL